MAKSASPDLEKTDHLCYYLVNGKEGVSMEKGKFLCDLKPGDSFRDSAFAVTGAEVRDAANGAYVMLTLRDATGQATAKKFQATEQERSVLLCAQLIVASGQVEAGPRYSGQINLTAVRKADLPGDLSAFLAPLPAHHELVKKNFRQLIGEVREPSLRRLLESIFAEDGEIWEPFCQAVAAGKIHHAYRGGLLEHTLEVATLCYHACKVFPKLNRDFLVTCALLHDIGKLDEMNHGLAAGEFTAAGALVGHIVLGSHRIAKAADEIPGFPEPAKNAILHLILSHHGLPEYGAARTPSFAEAHVLAQCDYISARVYQCLDAKERAQEGQITFWVGQESGRIFVGGLGLEEPAAEEPLSTPKIAAEFSTMAAAASSLEFNTAVRLSIVGRVAAGDPAKSSQEIEETKLVIPPPGGADYLLHVVGDSMDANGMLDGDLVFVKEAPMSSGNYKDGETVVARVEGEGETIKTLRYRASAEGQPEEAWLAPQSTNSVHQPRKIDEGVTVHGKIVGLLRDRV
jgi:3'-5' exoribonuclease